MTDVSERLDAIRERVEAATEGPWEVDWQGGDDFAVYADRTTCVLTGQVQDGDEHEATANAELTASARSDVPFLLSLIEDVGEALALLDDETFYGEITDGLDKYGRCPHPEPDGERNLCWLLEDLRDAALQQEATDG